MKKFISAVLTSVALLMTPAALANDVIPMPKRVWVIHDHQYIVPVTPENYPDSTYEERKNLREWLEYKRKNGDLKHESFDPKDIEKVDKEYKSNPYQIDFMQKLDSIPQSEAPNEIKYIEWVGGVKPIDIALNPNILNTVEEIEVTDAYDDNGFIQDEDDIIPVKGGKKIFSQKEATCLARAMFYEARGEGKSGQRAVGNVIINRAAFPTYFPNSICGVIAQRGQFQWYHNAKLRGGKVFSPTKHPELMNLAKQMIHEHNTGKRKDNSLNSYFFTSNGVVPSPNIKKRTRVGNHTFFTFKSSWLKKHKQYSQRKVRLQRI